MNKKKRGEMEKRNRMKQKRLFLSIAVSISIMSLAGCKEASISDAVENAEASAWDSAESFTETGTDMAESSMGEAEGNTASSEESQSGTEEKAEQDESGTGHEEGIIPEERPLLPDTGSSLADFVPAGWEIIDSVELDFNEDGISDYVGVLEAMRQDDPRILFAIAGDGSDGYRLDFQDINLIRTGGEGGVYGDPYLPLTAEGTSFTTHAYGGSAWRWWEEYTYTYREGVWWLTASENAYGYFDYTTSYSKNDWESGVGIRKERSREFGDMEENQDTAEYDVVYELSLDEPLTLEQAGKRWWLATKRVMDWEVASIILGEGTALSGDMVKLPDKAYIDYCDEDCVLYAVSDKDEGLYYLVMYRWQDKVLSVLAEEETEIDDLYLYKGKIYYSTRIEETVTYRTMQDGKEQITQEEDTVGIRLNRMELDGTGKETVFEYRYPKEEQEITEIRIPYLALLYEISGDEIVAEVYIGHEPHLFYRMKTDGSEGEKIGQMPKEP